jgi:hypothetical protein
MTPQEKDLITTLLGRLKGVARQPKDAEAEALIRQAVAEQPDMPYYLVQTVLIQDLSLQNAQNQIADLQRQLDDAQQAQRQTPTSFLGGLFGRSQPEPGPAPGPWSRSPQVAAAPPAQPQSYGPPSSQGGYAQPPAGPGGFMGSGAGGGFLRQAAATAAGIAGGALLFQGIQSLFGHQASAGILGSQAMTPGLGETVINNYYGSDAGGQDASAWGSGDQDYSSDAGGRDSGGWGSSDQDYSSDRDYASDQDYSSDSDFSSDDNNV